MKELVISKQAFSVLRSEPVNASASGGGSANQIDRLTGLEGLNGRLFS
jgi:hypothetical protein